MTNSDIGWHKSVVTSHPTCPHCYPEPEEHEKNKIDDILDYYFSRPFNTLVKKLLPKPLTYFARRYLKFSRLKLLYILKALQRTTELDRTQFRNYNLVLWDAALKKNLELYNFKINDKHTFYFLLIYKKQLYYFQYNPVYILYNYTNNFNDSQIYDYKNYFKKFLIRHQFPCAKGAAFTSNKKAFAYGLTLGFPLVVKPSHSSLSRHVTININSETKLKAAIKLAKQINYEIMVEQYIQGDNYRAIIFNQQLIACCRRQAASITGDGISTIAQLIELKNNHPLRGSALQRNATLHKIEKTAALNQMLAQQQVTFSTVLAKNKTLNLANKINTGNGADIIDVTTVVHPDIKNLLLDVARQLNISLAGLDFICEDIKISWRKQTFAILENNSLPFIDLHHFPTEGGAINVAEIIWDGILKSLDQK